MAAIATATFALSLALLLYFEASAELVWLVILTLALARRRLMRNGLDVVLLVGRCGERGARRKRVVGRIRYGGTRWELLDENRVC